MTSCGYEYGPSILFLQYRRLMRLEATYKYKKRIDARTSLAERKAQEDADMPVDPLDDLFTNSWNFFGTIMGKLLIPVMKTRIMSRAHIIQISYSVWHIKNGQVGEGDTVHATMNVVVLTIDESYVVRLHFCSARDWPCIIMVYVGVFSMQVPQCSRHLFLTCLVCTTWVSQT